MNASDEKRNKTLKDNFHGFDSLLRFYSSQIASHSNYLIAYAFALTVFSYRLLDRFLFEQSPFWVYDMALGVLFVIFVILGFYLYGRLLYYTELSSTVQCFMGLIQFGNPRDSVKLTTLVEVVTGKNYGLADVIIATLYSRIRRRLFGKAELEDYREVSNIQGWGISRKRAVYITLVNWISSSMYRKTMRKLAGYRA